MMMEGKSRPKLTHLKMSRFLVLCIICLVQIAQAQAETPVEFSAVLEEAGFLNTLEYDFDFTESKVALTFTEPRNDDFVVTGLNDLDIAVAPSGATDITRDGFLESQIPDFWGGLTDCPTCMQIPSIIFPNQIEVIRPGPYGYFPLPYPADIEALNVLKKYEDLLRIFAYLTEPKEVANAEKLWMDSHNQKLYTVLDFLLSDEDFEEYLSTESANLTVIQSITFREKRMRQIVQAMAIAHIEATRVNFYGEMP